MLRQFLPSVLTHSVYDVWVIDNASQDASLEVLRRDFSPVQLIELKENFGYAGGYNWGLAELQGKYQYYILLNSDVEVSPRWDRILVETLDENRQAAAVQPKILSYQDSHKFDYAGAGGGYLDSFYYPYCRGRIGEVLEEDTGQYDDTVLVDWASGACLAIRADLFHQMNGFDAHFFAHMEEIDLCVRMRQEGYQVLYNGKSAVLHLGGATLSRSSPRKLYLNIKNSLAMIYKAERGLRYYWIFLVKAIAEGAAALGYLIKGKNELSQAIWSGYRDFLASKDLFFPNKARSRFQKLGLSNWIYWDSLVLGKKTFKEL